MSSSEADAENPRVAEWQTTLEAPEGRSIEVFDARELPPPEPLSKTLERLATLDEDVVFFQINDREPRHLFPKLDDRGYRYDTTAAEDSVVTAVWR